MKKLVSTIGMDKKEWLKYRKNGIGGSDAGAVCGLNPYRTAIQVYQDKISDEVEEIDNEAMRQGREFEDYVARRFMEATGKKVRRANAMFYDEEHPFMFADVDRMVVMGYARVSSKEQNLDRQIMQLKEYVPEENIIVDKASGENFQREGYQALKGVLGLRRGDILVITSLDRLSRSKADTKKELQWFKEEGVRLKILDLPTSLIEIPEGQEWIRDMIENILIEVLSSIAEQERLTTKKRQREGIEAAKRKGKHLGRPKLKVPSNYPEIYEQWKSKQITAKKAMALLGISSSSFYRLVKKYEEDKYPQSSE